MKPELGLPKTGCDEGAAIAGVNEKVGPDDAPIDDPNTTGAMPVTEVEGVDAANAVDAANENPVEGDVVAGTEAVDAGKENPVEGNVVAGTEALDAGKENTDEGNVVAGTEAVDAEKEKPVEGVVIAATEAVDAEKDEPAEVDIELIAEPKIGGFVAGQLELNKLEAEPSMALLELASGEEAEPELKSLAVVEAENRELPEEKAVFPANPNEGADELHCTGMLLVRDETPVPANDAFALCTDSLPVPKTEEPD